APAAVNLRAMAAPRPRVAPVMRATRPSSENGLFDEVGSATGRHQILQPPSTTMLAPFTNPEASAERKTTAVTKSSGFPFRPTGVRSAVRARTASPSSLALDQGIMPGLRVLTVIPVPLVSWQAR